MKKFFVIMALAAAVCCFSSCMEQIDTLVQWGFAETPDSNISNGLETMLPSAVTIFDAFDKAFYGEYAKLGSGHEANMPAQSGKKSAINNAKRTAEKAHATLPSGHTCPANYYFVVRIKYGSDGSYETAWYHDYRK